MQDKIQLTATLEYYARTVLFEGVKEYVQSDIADRLFEDTSDSLEVGSKMKEAGYKELADAWENDEINKEDITGCIYVLAGQTTAEYVDDDNVIVFTVTYMLDLKELEELVDIRRRQQEFSYDAEHFKQLLKGVILYTSACDDIQGQLEKLTAMGFEEADLRYFGFKNHVLAEFYNSSEEKEENTTRIKTDVLNRTIEDLDLSIRAYCCLKKTNINTVGDILKYGASNLHNIRNIGNKACEEVIRAVKDKCGVNIQE